ncbi:MAG TPA: MarR family transcriptional regulator [Candidatus Dormibacteraeota bacterium]
MKKKPPDTHPPEDLMQHPGHLLRRAVQVMNLLWNEEVSHTITSPQFAALNALYSEPNLDQRTLGQRISLDRSTMADVVSRLSTRGFIRSVRDTRDGRRKTITLTPKGLQAVQQLIPRTRAMTKLLVGPLDEKERDELLCMLTKVVGANERRYGSRVRAVATSSAVVTQPKKVRTLRSRSRLIAAGSAGTSTSLMTRLAGSAST